MHCVITAYSLRAPYHVGLLYNNSIKYLFQKFRISFNFILRPFQPINIKASSVQHALHEQLHIINAILNYRKCNLNERGDFRMGETLYRRPEILFRWGRLCFDTESPGEDFISVKGSFYFGGDFIS